jgi:hypothetical protein
MTRIMRREQNAAAVRRAAVAARVAAMVFSLVAFSVLAADRNKGWALDSFNNYSQFRYSHLSVSLFFLFFYHCCFSQAMSLTMLCYYCYFMVLLFIYLGSCFLIFY